ncbi:MAG: NAD-dependent epimerase/dehydratase family protein [Methanobacteriota archaeon]|nr:MAG: NAD-dependent epimerase/dehydratase family protein [Euryarchaeota archaeon]
MKVLVTGSSGQLGSYVCERLRDRHDVRGLDLKEPTIAGMEAIVGDIRKREDVRGAVAGADVVVHCAAQVSVERSMIDPIGDAETNILGTINMLHESAEADVARFVYVSSAAVLGNPKYVPLDELHSTEPTSNYGASKLAGERFALAYGHSHDVEVVAVRPFNFYSPRADPSSPYSGVITRFTERVKKGRAPIIEGDGKQTRDFIHASDVAAFIDIVAEKAGISGEVLNCGSGVSTSVLELAKLVIRLKRLDLEPEYAPPRKGDIRDSLADMTKSTRILGFSTATTLEKGLSEMLR